MTANARAPTDRGREGESGGGEGRGLQRKSLEVDKLREQGGVLKVKKKGGRVQRFNTRLAILALNEADANLKQLEV